MKTFPAFLALLMTLGLLLPLQAADRRDATRVAFALGLGRAPASTEMAHTESFESIIEAIRQDLVDAPDQHRAVAARANKFVYGPSSEPAETEQLLFADIVAKHLSNLSQNQLTYQQVLRRAYQHVVGRDVYVEEIEYWNKHPTLPYALLVGCIEDWARRNQPGLMNTSGAPTISINCELLDTARVPLNLAPQVEKALGLPASTPVLAPGGTGIRSSGNIGLVVIGTR